MKKSLVLVLVLTFLTACTLVDSSSSIEKLKKTPEDVQGLLDPAVPLQSVNKNGEMTYLIYKSEDEVTASLEQQGDGSDRHTHKRKIHFGWCSYRFIKTWF